MPACHEKGPSLYCVFASSIDFLDLFVVEVKVREDFEKAIALLVVGLLRISCLADCVRYENVRRVAHCRQMLG